MPNVNSQIILRLFRKPAASLSQGYMGKMINLTHIIAWKRGFTTVVNYFDHVSTYSSIATQPINRKRKFTHGTFALVSHETSKLVQNLFRREMKGKLLWDVTWEFGKAKRMKTPLQTTALNLTQFCGKNQTLISKLRGSSFWGENRLGVNEFLGKF